MDLYVRNRQREVIGIIDVYHSLIWTPRYYSAGDFELYLPASAAALELLQQEFYLTRLDDAMIGIIERVELKNTNEGIPYLTVSGRSAEALLERRIVWSQTNLKGTAEACIRKLLTENAFQPADSNRILPDFQLGDMKGFSETMETQVTGNNLLECISSICKTYGYGFTVTLDSDNRFVFDLVRGENRSYQQSVNPYVVFSPDFDNLSETEYVNDVSNLSTVALVAGEGEGTARKTASVGMAAGLERRELYVDARDMSTNGNEITEADYLTMLRDRGKEKLSERSVSEGFSGKVEIGLTYQYKRDFFLGDVIQIKNEFGIAAAPRIVEIIESDNENGYSVIPTFEKWEV